MKAGSEGQPDPPLQEDGGTTELSQDEQGEGGGGRLVQVFPQTPSSLACFSGRNTDRRQGNSSEKRLHLLPALLARLRRRNSGRPPTPGRSGSASALP